MTDRVMLSVDEARAVGAVIVGLREDVDRLIEAGEELIRAEVCDDLRGATGLTGPLADWDAAVKAARGG